jgi:hypothetical protein
MPSEKQTAEEFREEQRRIAASQGQTAENAVPEQRPIASQVPSLPESDVQQALAEEGANDPMPKSAYDRAASKEQAKKAEKAGKSESTRSGQRIKITSGPYAGSFAAVLEVNYKNFEEEQKARSGNPGLALYAEVDHVVARTRGGRHDLVSLKPDEYEHVEERDYERGVA